jgi:serine protease inhibitor ecotin
VYKKGERYQAMIGYGGTQHTLGTFETKEHAGIAYDRFVIDKNTEEVSFTLNYPNMSDSEREEALKVEEPVQEKRGNPNQKTGMIGVAKMRKKYMAYIKYGGKTKSLGTFDTKERAGIAYDRFVVDKSTEEVSFHIKLPQHE